MTAAQPIRVLLVEDNAGDAFLIQELTSEERARPVAIEVRSTLAAAIETVGEAHYDAILIDLGLPDSTGVATFERMHEHARSTPVVVLTGHDDLATASRCMELGAHDYLVKGRADAFLAGAIYNTVARARAQLALNESYDNTKRLVADFHDAVLVLDDRGTVLYANAAASRLFRGRIEPGQDCGLVIDGGRVQEVDVPAPDGESRVVEMRVSDSSWYGEPARVVALRDVTERKVARQRLEHLNRVLAAIRNVNQLIVREKDAGRLVQEACEMLVATRGYRTAWIRLDPNAGWEAGRVAAAGADRSFSEKMLDGWRPPCEVEARTNGRTVHVADHARDCAGCLLGEDCRAKVAACLMLRHQGSTFGALGVAVPDSPDLSADEEGLLVEVAEDLGFALHGIEVEVRRQKSEARLAARERLLSFAIEQMPVPVIIADAPDVTIQRYNQPVLDMLAKQPADLAAVALEDHRTFWPTFHPDGTPYRVEDLPLTQAIKEGKTTRNREILVRQGDRERWISASAAPLHDEDGEILAGIVVFPEVTEIKQAASALQESSEMLQQSQRMESIGRLAGGVAHDFNNLLTVISSNAQFVLDELEPDAPAHADMQQLLEASQRASTLTRQLLAFSRKQMMAPRVLDLNEVVAGLEKMLRRMIGEDIELVTVLPGDVGRVRADPGQLEQVLMNLAVNARDAMPTGGKLEVETSNVRFDEHHTSIYPGVGPGNYVMLAVSDTGKGMPPEVRDRIFEPFFTTKDKSRGTGLGLSMVYGIVKQSDGHVAVHSEIDRGTRFEIYLPRVEAETARKRSSETPRSSRGTETILVVEDEQGVRNLTRRILSAAGYQVIVAASGDEALAACESCGGHIHLMLTDVVMPGMSGKALADKLTQRWPRLRVLYMSGYTDNAIVHHGVLDEGTELVEKPFNAAGLLAKVRMVLDRNRE